MKNPTATKETIIKTTLKVSQETLVSVSIIVGIDSSSCFILCGTMELKTQLLQKKAIITIIQKKDIL